MWLTTSFFVCCCCCCYNSIRANQVIYVGSKTLPHKVGFDDDVVNFCEVDFDPLDCIELVA